MKNKPKLSNGQVWSGNSGGNTPIDLKAVTIGNTVITFKTSKKNKPKRWVLGE